ncbi:hypothetical protein [Niveibacterium umoris]|nr:hypothetical protein [Niveibacterium umoris]
MAISQSAEAARHAGIRVEPHFTSQEALSIHSEQGVIELAGPRAVEFLERARKLWGLAGVVSLHMAMLHCASEILAKQTAA